MSPSQETANPCISGCLVLRVYWSGCESSTAMNSTVQEEEVQALRAIYDQDFRTVSDEERSYAITITVGGDQVGGDDHTPSHTPKYTSVELQLTFPEDYPSSAPPVYEIRASWLNSEDFRTFADTFSTIYRECQGEVVVHRWVEWVREFVTLRAQQLQEDSAVPSSDLQPSTLEEVTVVASGSEISRQSDSCHGGKSREVQCPDIVHGEPLTDRKSTFQAHAATVSNVAEVEAVLLELKSSRKIATATHNILAYRLYDSGRGVYLQDYDDDGETAAGSRLLHLLQIMDVQNVMVVVTRWFGGILLHADRFKHINNVARIVLQESGLGSEHQKVDKAKPKKSKAGRHR